ncbi:MAG: hypothetical protein OEY64_05645 [Nitrospinota bacterium]|nr:hypothetical protein [Nitrospinota bacterium]
MGEVKSIGFLLFGGPNSQDCTLVEGISSAALKRGIHVEIFMMYEAVLNSANEKFLKLADDGAKITVCAHNSDELKVQRSDKFHYGSQYDHSKMIYDVDRYIALT